MGKYIYDMILMGISSAIMLVSAQVLYYAMKRKHARRYYAMLVSAVLMLILPIQSIVSVPKMVRVTVPENMSYMTAAAEVPKGISAVQIIFFVWAAAACIMLLFSLCKYIKTRKVLKEISEITSCRLLINTFCSVKASMGIRAEIELRESRYIHSPLLFGIIKPMVIIPSREFTEDELTMIMTHELTHHRHRDLLIKLLASIAACVQWFNPEAHILKRLINTACELCCDETVLDILEPEDKKDYGRLILSVIEASANRRLFCTTSMAASGKGIKRRLMGIIEFKRHGVIFKTVSVMLLISVAVCSVTAFGVEFAKEILPQQTAERIEEIQDTPVFPRPVTQETNSPSPKPTATANKAKAMIGSVQESGRGSVSTVENNDERDTGYEYNYSEIISAYSGNTADTEIESGESKAEKSTNLSVAEVDPAPVKTEADEAYRDAPQRSENTGKVNIVINNSKNFEDERITERNPKTVEVNTNKDTDISGGENVKAYIKVNDDGSYDLIRSEKRKEEN